MAVGNGPPGGGDSGEVDELRARIDELEQSLAEYTVLADAIKHGERHLSLLYDVADLPYHSLDPAGHILDVNAAWLELLGYERSEVIGRWIGDFMVDPNRDAFATNFANFVATGAVRDIPFDLHHKDGLTVQVLVDGRIGRDESGEFDRTHCILRERSGKDSELRAERARAQRYLDIAGVMIVVIGADERIRLINRKGCEILGRSAEELVGANWFDIAIPAAERAAIREVFGKATNGKLALVEYHENEIITADGTSRHISWHNSALHDAQGEVTGTLSSGEDITERKLSEARERHHSRGLAMLADTAMELAQFPSDADLESFLATRLAELLGGACVTLVTEIGDHPNQLTVCAMAGAPPEVTAILGRDPVGLVATIDEELAAEHLHGRLIEAPMRLDELTGGAITSDQARHLQETLGFSAFYTIGAVRRGRLLGTLAILERGRTAAIDRPLVEAFAGQAAAALRRRRAEQERAELEERLLHSQKMEAIGTLAGGIAHDFNNLLTGIIGQAWVLKRQLDAEDPICHGIEAIETAAMRAAELTKQLLGFARKGKMENVTVDIRQVIDEVISILRHTLDKRIIVITATEEAHPLVAGDPTQLQQVLLNLAVNARDAMPEGGMLTVETKNVTWDVGRPGKFLRVSVKDTGTGISAEIRERIFEPFFTTKPRDQGTGMGLAMVYGIVENHGGWIEVDANDGGGSRFAAYLPIAADNAVVEAAEVVGEPIGGEARILVVDDEPAIRDVVEQILPPLGYRVAYACDGQEAVDYYREHGDEIELALIDLVMPVMNGASCFRALKAINPAVRVLMVSGHGVDDVGEELVGEGLLGFVSKPFSPTALTQAIARALSD